MNGEVAPNSDNLQLVRSQSSMQLFPPSNPCLQYLEYMSAVHPLNYRLNGDFRCGLGYISPTRKWQRFSVVLVRSRNPRVFTLKIEDVLMTADTVI